MMRLLKVALAGGVIFALQSCGESGVSKDMEQQEFIYEQAIQIGDWDVARMATYKLMALDSNNKSYFDTLARLYHETRDFPAQLKSCQNALEFAVTDKTLGLAYEASNSLGYHTDAITYGEMLMESHADSLQLLYAVAMNYVSTGNPQSAEALLNKVVLHVKSGDEVKSEQAQKGFQEVNYRACAYNSLGYLKQQAGLNEEAIEWFEKALELNPNYFLAAYNLQFTQQSIAQAAVPE